MQRIRKSGTRTNESGYRIRDPEYIAPEQIQQAREAGIRADIYGLGCTLYFLLTGNSPFQRGDIESTLKAQLHERLPDPRTSVPNVPEPVVSLLNYMTAKRPEDRPNEPQEVATQIDEILKLTQNNEVAPIKSTAWNRRSYLGRVTIGLAALGLCAYGAAASGIFGQQPTRLLVILPSDGLWFPDYRELVQGAEKIGTKLTFASPSDRPSQVLSTSEPGIAVPDIKLSRASRQLHMTGLCSWATTPMNLYPTGSRVKK